MTLDHFIDRLGLPPESMVNHRVPKTLLVENGAPTAADKRQINDGIEELRWVAALKPNTAAVAAYADESREVLELAVLTLRLRPKAKLPRLTTLVHRAIPYHLMLVTEQASDELHLSLADKRWSQSEGGRVVLDGDLVTCELHAIDEVARDRLLDALPVARQPRTDLYALYRGWINAVLAAQAASITGEFTMPDCPHRAAERKHALRTCEALQSRIASVRSAASKEKQMARQVEMNLELKKLRAEYDAARAKL